MWANNSYLELCAALKEEVGYPLRMAPGEMVGRGFADIGYEAFSVLTGDRVVSLFTGEVKQIQESELSHFFSVPNVDQLVSFLDEKDIDVEELTKNGGVWKLVVSSRDVRSESEDRSLTTLFSKALLENAKP